MPGVEKLLPADPGNLRQLASQPVDLQAQGEHVREQFGRGVHLEMGSIAARHWQRMRLIGCPSKLSGTLIAERMPWSRSCCSEAAEGDRRSALAIERSPGLRGKIGTGAAAVSATIAGRSGISPGANERPRLLWALCSPQTIRQWSHPVSARMRRAPRRAAPPRAPGKARRSSRRPSRAPRPARGRGWARLPAARGRR